MIPNLNIFFLALSLFIASKKAIYIYSLIENAHVAAAWRYVDLVSA